MRLLVLLGALVLSACENREAFRTPTPSLARMLEQKRANPYGQSDAFEDRRAMRLPPPGTVPRDEDDVRPSVTRALVSVGRTRFEVVCAACHGVLGDGTSIVASKMAERQPPSLHEARVRSLRDDDLFRVVSEGYGMMPSYTDVLSFRERWAIVEYVRALQLSQNARVAELPEGMRRELLSEAP
jgi:mono/diheme cytochrome c family protein